MRPRTYQQLACDLALAAPLGITAKEVHADLHARHFRLSVSMAAKSLRRLTAAGEVVRVKVEGRVRFCSSENAAATLAQMQADRMALDKAAKTRKRKLSALRKRRVREEGHEPDDRPFVHRWRQHQPLPQHQLDAAVPSVWHLSARS